MNKNLPYLLHVANANPRAPGLYSTKDAILKKYGKRVSQDLQHILLTCSHCAEGKKNGRICRRCHGMGVRTERYIKLGVYKLGEFEFHIPEEHVGIGIDRSLYRNVIEGYIIHEGVPFYDSYDALMMICLITGDYGKFWRLFNGSVDHLSFKNGFVSLATIYAKTFGRLFKYIGLKKYWIKNKLSLLKRVFCKHDFTKNKYVCSKCRFSNPDYDDIPF